MVSAGAAAPWSLQGQVALVTGASRGIGAGIALTLAAAGADLVLTYRRHADEAAAVAAAVEGLGCRAHVLPLDLRAPGDADSLAGAAANRAGGVDVLVNNAGIYPHSDALAMPDEEWDDVVAVNLTGAFRVARAVGRLMAERGQGGRIINVGSIAAHVSDFGMSHYTASKAGLQGLTRALALELAAHDITVNCVEPGLIDAPELSANAPELAARFLRRAPLRRLGQPADVGAAVHFLASPAAGWITGQCLIVDGGVSIAPQY